MSIRICHDWEKRVNTGGGVDRVYGVVSGEKVSQGFRVALIANEEGDNESADHLHIEGSARYVRQALRDLLMIVDETGAELVSQGRISPNWARDSESTSDERRTAACFIDREGLLASLVSLGFSLGHAQKLNPGRIEEVLRKYLGGPAIAHPEVPVPPSREAMVSRVQALMASRAEADLRALSEVASGSVTAEGLQELTESVMADPGCARTLLWSHWDHLLRYCRVSGDVGAVARDGLDLLRVHPNFKPSRKEK